MLNHRPHYNMNIHIYIYIFFLKYSNIVIISFSKLTSWMQQQDIYNCLQTGSKVMANSNNESGLYKALECQSCTHRIHKVHTTRQKHSACTKLAKKMIMTQYESWYKKTWNSISASYNTTGKLVTLDYKPGLPLVCLVGLPATTFRGSPGNSKGSCLI